jgi:hypothetical protein
MGVPATDTAAINVIDANVDSLVSSVEILSDHFHTPQQVYPNLATAVSVVSTNGAGSWTPGADTEVIPIDTITSIYDLHFVSIATIGANASFQLDFYQGANGAGTHIGSVTFARQDNFQRSFFLPITCPRLAANRRVYAKLADDGDAGITITLKVWYHIY